MTTANAENANSSVHEEHQKNQDSYVLERKK